MRTLLLQRRFSERMSIPSVGFCRLHVDPISGILHAYVFGNSFRGIQVLRTHVDPISGILQAYVFGNSFRGIHVNTCLPDYVRVCIKCSRAVAFGR